jgi:HSP20 family protein
MEIKKWMPWNWFEKEEKDEGKTVPVRRDDAQDQGMAFPVALQNFHREVDRIFNQAFRGFSFGPTWLDGVLWPRMADGMLKPTLDLSATDKEYTIAVEIPGVDEKDVKLEIANDTLTIRGEKKQEKEEKGKNFYRVERSYGSFQRVLSLPEDADQTGVKATFKRGILTISMPRKTMPQSDVRKIDIKSA